MLIDLDGQYLLDFDTAHGKGDINVLTKKIIGVFVNECQTDFNRIGAKKCEGQNKQIIQTHVLY